LRTLGQVEASSGQWDAGLAHFRQATLLDPRSPAAADRLSRAYLLLRRYPEARAAADRGLVSSPDNLVLHHDRMMSFAGEGDLAGVHDALHKAYGNVDRAALLAYVTNYWDTFWMLDSADVAFAQTLPVAAFDGDRDVWGIVKAELYSWQGDSVRARAYADSARLVFDQQLRQDTTNWQSFLMRALTHAIRGRRSEAIRDRDRGLAGALSTGDEWSSISYAHHIAARVDVALGDRDAAIAELRAVLSKPYFISPAWLRIDPAWDPLRGDPRFEKLAHSDGK
jgi:tetratricopeptide (TPR) repeat protein